MTYRILNRESVEQNAFDSFEEFCDNFDMSFYPSDEWCYLYFIKGTEALPEDCPVSWFLAEAIEDLTLNNTTDPATIQFSVTSKEKRHQEWLEAIQGVPGHSIQEIIRPQPYVAHRTVYLCSFPTHPVL